MLTVFIVYLAINVILEVFRFRKKWIEGVVYTAIAIMMLTNPRSIHQHKLNLEARCVDYQNKQIVINLMQGLPPADALLLITDNWHVKKESALIFGLFMTPSGRVYFGNIPDKHYHHTYLFKESDRNFYHWFDALHTPVEYWKSMIQWKALLNTIAMVFTNSLNQLLPGPEMPILNRFTRITPMMFTYMM